MFPDSKTKPALVSLTILSRGELTPNISVIDKIEEKEEGEAPKIPENNN